MIETLILALLAGGVLGLFFFGGLWITVRKGMQAAVPAAWFLLSFLVRMAVALAGFYGIATLGEWQHLTVALLGFVVARMVLTRIAPEPLADPLMGAHQAALGEQSDQEQQHAP